MAYWSCRDEGRPLARAKGAGFDRLRRIEQGAVLIRDLMPRTARIRLRNNLESKSFSNALDLFQRILSISTMVTTVELVNPRAAAYRERQFAAGRAHLSVYLPADVVEGMDRLKEAKGFTRRADVIEEALRRFIEANEGTK